MGAVFIYKKGTCFSLEKAVRLFEEKGFSSPKYFEFNNWHIYCYPKINGQFKNYTTYKDITLISVGSPIYKGLSYENSLNELIRDYCQKTISLQDLIGHYSLFFCCKDTINILCDPLNIKHLFTDSNNSIISSSMLAIATSLKDDLHINKYAVYEKLLTGFIMSPNTYFREIVHLNLDETKRINKLGIGLYFISNPFDNKNNSNIYSNKNNCVLAQADYLLRYFALLKEQSNQGIDIGLSGGYDSRLALACINRYFHDSLHLHSHATENDHDKELKVVEQLTNYIDVPCHIVPTKRLNHCDNVDDILINSVLYFDGRTSFSIGGCGQVYTAEYRKKTIENTPMTITGAGGELYRNVFNIPGKRISLDHFMRNKVFSHSLKKALNKDIYENLSEDLIMRAAKRLKTNPANKIHKTIAHRYYCEIMMPDGQGNAIDAYNQISCCVSPFLDPIIIKKGYEGIRFHADGGDFEGLILDSIDHGLASINSSYGYPLNNRPFGIRVKEHIRSFFPNRVWQFLSDVKYGNTKNECKTYNDVLQICEQGSKLKSALDELYRLFHEIDFSHLVSEEEGIRRVVFVAMTIFYINDARK